MHKQYGVAVAAGLVFALVVGPVDIFAGGKDAGTVHRDAPVRPTTPEHILITPPDTSAQRALGPNERQVIVNVKGWYCTGEIAINTMVYNINERRKNKKGLLRLQEQYDNNYFTEDAFDWSLSPLAFWELQILRWGNRDREEKLEHDWTWVLSPAQGQSITKSKDHCYTLQELSAMKLKLKSWLESVVKEKGFGS